MSAKDHYQGPVRTLEEDEVTRERCDDSTSCKTAVDDGTVDTVLLCIADMEGRLQGKRLTARHFLDEVVEHAAEGCNYLLAVDVDMNTSTATRCRAGSAATATS